MGDDRMIRETGRQILSIDFQSQRPRVVARLDQVFVSETARSPTTPLAALTKLADGQ